MLATYVLKLQQKSPKPVEIRQKRPIYGTCEYKYETKQNYAKISS